MLSGSGRGSGCIEEKFYLFRETNGQINYLVIYVNEALRKILCERFRRANMVPAGRRT